MVAMVAMVVVLAAAAAAAVVVAMVVMVPGAPASNGRVAVTRSHGFRSAAPVTRADQHRFPTRRSHLRHPFYLALTCALTYLPPGDVTWDGRLLPGSRAERTPRGEWDTRDRKKFADATVAEHHAFQEPYGGHYSQLPRLGEWGTSRKKGSPSPARRRAGGSPEHIRRPRAPEENRAIEILGGKIGKDFEIPTWGGGSAARGRSPDPRGRSPERGGWREEGWRPGKMANGTWQDGPLPVQQPGRVCSRASAVNAGAAKRSAQEAMTQLGSPAPGLLHWPADKPRLARFHTVNRCVGAPHFKGVDAPRRPSRDFTEAMALTKVGFETRRMLVDDFAVGHNLNVEEEAVPTEADEAKAVIMQARQEGEEEYAAELAVARGEAAGAGEAGEGGGGVMNITEWASTNKGPQPPSNRLRGSTLANVLTHIAATEEQAGKDVTAEVLGDVLVVPTADAVTHAATEAAAPAGARPPPVPSKDKPPPRPKNLTTEELTAVRGYLLRGPRPEDDEGGHDESGQGARMVPELVGFPGGKPSASCEAAEVEVHSRPPKPSPPWVLHGLACLACMPLLHGLTCLA